MSNFKKTMEEFMKSYYHDDIFYNKNRKEIPETAIRYLAKGLKKSEKILSCSSGKDCLGMLSFENKQGTDNQIIVCKYCYDFFGINGGCNPERFNKGIILLKEWDPNEKRIEIE